MPKADRIHTTGRRGSVPAPSRRALLGAAALAPVAAVPALADALPMAAVPAATVVTQPTNPDADLIRICAEHRKNLLAFNADGLDDDESPFWAPYVRAIDAIDEAKPRTLAGLRAKALAARLEAGAAAHWQETKGGDWAWDLVQDLVRLTGGDAA